MSASTPQDTSNSDTITGSLETRRLVPYDNNIAQRDVTVEPYPVQYSVKFVCGSSSGGPVAPGSYFTAINIHNPTDQKIRFRKKVAVALRDVVGRPHRGKDGVRRIKRRRGP